MLLEPAIKINDILFYWDNKSFNPECLRAIQSPISCFHDVAIPFLNLVIYGHPSPKHPIQFPLAVMAQYKLNVFEIQVVPSDVKDKSNRILFNLLTNQVGTNADDKKLFVDVFKEMVKALDKDEMFNDPGSRKTMTLNHSEDTASPLNKNISYHSEKYVVEGKIEGGSFGVQRNKVSTLNKTNKVGVNQDDAITQDFYFLFFLPPWSDKMVLMIQSGDDSIDSVMKVFCQNFFQHSPIFKKPRVRKFYPKHIIDDFKKGATISRLTFSTETQSETLLGKSKIVEKDYRITVTIEPLKKRIDMLDFNQDVSELSEAKIGSLALKNFRKKNATLRDQKTNRPSDFEIGSDFEIQPTIYLSKYLDLKGDGSDFEKIKNYCFGLLEKVRSEIYAINGIKER